MHCLTSPLHPCLYLIGKANLGHGASGDAGAGASDEPTQQLELSHFQSSGEDPKQDGLHPQSGKHKLLRKCCNSYDIYDIY